jgi:uncharacterized protein (DUF2062 family)
MNSNRPPRRRFSLWRTAWGLCLRLLRQGTSAHKLALALALGFSISICPVIGPATVILTILALLLRLNLPLIQAANYAASPLQWLLILPFIRLGSALFGRTPVTASAADLASLASRDAAGFLRRFGATALHALGAWALLLPVLIPLLYWIFLAILRKKAPVMPDARARMTGPTS